MADADFVPVPAKGLLHDAFLARRGAGLAPGMRLQPATLTSADPRPFDTAGRLPGVGLAMAEPGPGTENGTTHFSAADQWGNVVSYTNTIEAPYGIGVFAGYRRADGSLRNHGFLLNNELTDFNTTPSTNPWTMLFAPDGKPMLAYGSPGGATIINSVVNVTVNLVDHRMGLQQAVDAARLSVVGAGSTIQLENRFPNLATLQQALGPEGLGYTVAVGDVGSVQAVLIDPRSGLQYGAADDRREGSVVGLPRPQGR